ncbi:MAG: hypothetical protein ACFFKA_18520, partial [Candidatus Thorarchaeota archaeon]
LSLFLIHYSFITLFIWYFDFLVFIVICLSYVGFMGFLMFVWNEFLDGKGSPEWLMVQIGRIGRHTSKKIKKEIIYIEGEAKHTLQKLKHKETKGEK